MNSVGWVKGTRTCAGQRGSGSTLGVSGVASASGRIGGTGAVTRAGRARCRSAGAVGAGQARYTEKKDQLLYVGSYRRVSFVSLDNVSPALCLQEHVVPDWL